MSVMKTLRRMGVAVMMTALTGGGSVQAGGLDPTNAPGPTMHTLEEIYQKSQYVAPVQTLSPTTTAVKAGYYAPTTLDTVDPDLATGNIRAGVTVFGVAGDSNVVDTSSGDAASSDILAGRKGWVDGREVVGTAIVATHPAEVPKTGAGDLPSYAEVPGEDGHAAMRKGVPWPDPRFTDNGDGTVTDNLTGLIWLKKASYIKTDYPGFDTDKYSGTEPNGDGGVFWTNAMRFVAGMNSGTYSNFGYTDWRVPNIRELQSLFDFGRGSPALPQGHPFTDVDTSGRYTSPYWSSTSLGGYANNAWYVMPNDGMAWAELKIYVKQVWPVRGGP